ncbi:hypothetical protein [Lancefieldella parvula]|uniref:hypothetical protein n=1 Tax=Lancefieldella parvula TaxID=1382 RepID=UPI00290F42F6|nr:hypothetical protein [Lancefieldella parvula]MDU4868406.1 hypothetical protein [Lancefieldella parvula]
MISREEVAKKWREAGERLDKEAPSNLTAAAYTTLFELLESAGIREGNSYSDVFSRLADLIDPTCKDVSEPPKDGFTPVPFFKCSECGCQHISPEYVRYCPGCGARVVRDE